MVIKNKRIYRASKEDSMIGGVCAGFAEYFEIDPTIIRLLSVFLALGWGFGIFAYLICWIVIPRKEEAKNK
jgi:phage shock protein PspC (stress-responsive transcriptional regulator)